MVFEKIHQHPRPYQQERRALQTWAVRLPLAPRLILGEDRRRALWTVGLPGVRPSAASWTPALLRAAGVALAQLHHLPHDDTDPVNTQDALQMRVHGALHSAGELGDVPSELDARLRALRVEGARVPCHRDFQPANWLWTRSGALGLVDFEHSRADLAAWDLVKLDAEVFLDHPQLREPFREGYGSLPSDAVRTGLLALHGLVTWTWGRRHQAPAFEVLGSRVLTHLGLAMRARDQPGC